jgi:hypothetical protein
MNAGPFSIEENAETILKGSELRALEHTPETE